MIYADAERIESGEMPAFPQPCEGDEVLVQIVKLPVGKKGAKVNKEKFDNYFRIIYNGCRLSRRLDIMKIDFKGITGEELSFKLNRVGK